MFSSKLWAFYCIVSFFTWREGGFSAKKMTRIKELISDGLKLYHAENVGKKFLITNSVYEHSNDLHLKLNMLYPWTRTSLPV